MSSRDTKHVRPIDTNSLVGAILLVLAALSLGLVIWQSLTRDLTGLESTLFASLTFILSTAGSFIVSAHFNQTQAKREYEQLARPSLRRVNSLLRAVSLLEQSAEARVAEIDKQQNSKEELIWLEGLQSNMRFLKHQIHDATTDWRELLPAEYEDALAEAREQSEQHEALIQKLEENLREQRRLAESGDKEAKGKIASLEKSLRDQKAAAKASEIRLQLSTTPTYGRISTPLLTSELSTQVDYLGGDIAKKDDV